MKKAIAEKARGKKASPATPAQRKKAAPKPPTHEAHEAPTPDPAAPDPTSKDALIGHAAGHLEVMDGLLRDAYANLGWAYQDLMKATDGRA